MSSVEHDAARLAAYALGALDPAEAQAVHAHLAGCADCRREVGEITGLRRALDEVPPEAFLDGPPAGGDLLLRRTLHRARARGPTPRHTGRTGRTIAVAAAVVVVAAALGGGILIGRQSGPSNVAQPPTSTTTTTPSGARTAEATDPDTGATMALTLTPKAGWTAVSAKVGGVPAGTPCELYIVPRTGEPVLAGSWLVSEKGEADGTLLEGTALVDPTNVQAVEVVTTNGHHLISVPL